MDVYTLTRKQRPSRLTLAQPSSRTNTLSDNDSGLDVSSVSSNKPLVFDQVTGSPSRDHWKKDAEANACCYIGCPTSFGLFERRHHYQFAQFHPRGILSRGCDVCAADYIQWQEELRQPSKSRRKSTAIINNNQINLKKRHAGIMTQQPQAMEGVTELGRDDIVVPSPKSNASESVSIAKPNNKKDQVFNPIPSVPADWQWSTF
ncbi:FYVE-type zinc finger-containing protein C9B6.03 [Choanephora cucurbitarum]|uniref:FYVE-type zinc finger-containing protein C9B6.03 n=1 Tax=Choanephora cucurbitarum TaxID=101091 RepID=A0A1C7NQL3_9FUNG|nr:FYVE-type zinc finger-containing protein C9B6.03 [Choanephora cucurbitarum]